LKKLFKPGKTPAPHHETHIEPVAAPIAPAAPGPATSAPTAAGDDRPAKKEGRQRQRRQKTQAPKPPAKPWSINDFVVEQAEGKTRFHDFPLPDSLMRGIQDQGFKYCTPIHAQVLVSTLLGHDAIGRAQTGTGKTAACLMSSTDQLQETPPPAYGYVGAPRAVINAPTRELVMRIASGAEGLTRPCGLIVKAFVGGMDYDRKLNHLERK